jgi:ornithine carbamoyltransferase
VTPHFLDVTDLTPGELLHLLDVADALAADRRRTDELGGMSVGLLFEKPSTRTRVSFDVAVHELGGHPVVLNASDLQLGRGETLEDTARTLSGYLAAVVIRTFAHERLERIAAAASVPVVNALSDRSHPCQALADLQTIRQEKGRLEGVRVGYVGDGNNVAVSLAQAGAMTGMKVTIASPPGYGLRDVDAELTEDPLEAAAGADVLYTDVWTSMGQEAEQAARVAALRPYALTSELLGAAQPDAIVLHCLPAHRGEEIAAEVLDGPQSRVWPQAANRLHAQKALLLHLLGGGGR